MKKVIFALAAILLPGTLVFGQAEPKGFPILKGPFLGQTPPGTMPEMFAPGIVSTDRVEHGTVVFSPDGDEVFWATCFNDPFRKKIMTMRRVHDVWMPPQIASFSLGTNEGNPCVSSDGKKVFFTGWQKADSYEKSKHLIMVSEKTDDGWSPPRLMPRVINEISRYWDISVASNGNFYFVSEKDGGGIFRSKFVAGQYAPPEKIDLGFKGGGPCIAADESYIVFSAFDRPDGHGGGDLYISFRKDDLSWTTGVNLGSRINTEKDELWPIISLDGKFLFFTSARRENPDIYWVSAEVIEDLGRRNEEIAASLARRSGSNL